MGEFAVVYALRALVLDEGAPMATQSDIDDLVVATSRLLGTRVGLHQVLAGGTHAAAIVVHDGSRQLVARRFPHGDAAAHREVEVYPQIAALGDLVPQLVASGGDPERPVIVTTRMPGTAPSAALTVGQMALEMAAVLARVHALPGTGLRVQPDIAPDGPGPLAARARAEFPALDTSERVLTHLDFWCGNLMWSGAQAIGVVDWSGASHGPRGMDLAWCRQDLVLLGSAEAADVFLVEYQRIAGVAVDNILAWDVQVAARAEDRVETWAPNYQGIGRTDLTPQTLRQRLDAWNARL